MTEDPHTPTSAGPTPEKLTAEAGATAPQPTPTVPASEASWSRPPGTAAAEGAAETPMADRPEVLVGAAFAGGLVAAQILKRLGR
jgi:hypothetical protein